MINKYELIKNLPLQLLHWIDFQNDHRFRDIYFELKITKVLFIPSNVENKIDMDNNFMIVTMALAFLIFLFGIRYLYNKEKLAMIEKGANYKPQNESSFTTNKLSFLLIGIGVGMFISFLLSELVLPDVPNEPIYFSIVPICAGIALIVSQKMKSTQ